ncbi:MAG: hypothetical protein V1905_03475 [bacterium]
MKTKKLKKDKVIEIGALLEDFNSKFGLVAEQTSQIPEIKDKIDDLTGDIRIVKEDMLTVKKDMVIVKTDLEFIKGALKKKVDIDEFSALERRVISLESRLH